MSTGRTVTILGPQRVPTLDQAVRRLSGDAPIAMITAGWQEREPDDAEVDRLLGGRGVQLDLYARWQNVLARDPEFAQAELEHRAVLDEMQLLYLTQLDHVLGSLYAVARRAGDRPRTRRAALADTMAVVKLVDERHIRRVKEAHQDFYGAWQPHERPLLAEHREQVHAMLEASVGVVVAGGHVGVLNRVLHLFNVTPFLPDRVIAWSAGAMALSDRIVLFHDRAPQGPAHAEVYDEGVGVVEGAVFLPHARRRLMVDDLTRMSTLATRFAPATCVVLDDGMRLELGVDGELPASTRVIDEDGRIRSRGAAA